jgi:hypothetical protein
MMILALIPKSIYDLNNANNNSMFSWQRTDETHIILHKDNIADLSNIQIYGAKF